MGRIAEFIELKDIWGNVKKTLYSDPTSGIAYIVILSLPLYLLYRMEQYGETVSVTTYWGRKRIKWPPSG